MRIRIRNPDKKMFPQNIASQAYTATAVTVLWERHNNML